MTSTTQAKKAVYAELITIGDEILYGQILDTNAQWMSKAMDRSGIRLVRHTTVGDEMEQILAALSEGSKRADIVLVTGGLGPTSDDLTRPALARYFNVALEMNEIALAHVRQIFESRGRELTEVNRMQAVLPVNCELLHNENGTAPGMWFEEEGTVFVSMPGVPHEMKGLVTHEVLPRIREKFDLPVLYHKIIRTAGIGESWLSDKIKTWEEALPRHIRLAYLPSLGQVRLRLTASGDDLEMLQKDVELQVEKLLPLAQKYIYGYDDTTLEVALGQLLCDRGHTLATAESCTGGYVAHMVTSVPGSSDYFLGSVVAYHNRIKTNELGVDPEIIEAHGAVSEPTVIAMAKGIRRRLGASIGIATSGVAGPGGGTAEKPVGTVWIAVDSDEHTTARKLQLTTDRMINIQLSAVGALNLVRQTLTGND